MILREPSAAEHASVVRLGRAAFAPLGNYRHAMKDWLENPGVATRVAVAGEQVAGFVMVAVLDDANGRHGYVLAIGVDDGHRRQGIGKQLLACGVGLLLGEHERLEFSELRATIAEDNAPAQRLFMDAGFDIRSESAAPYQGGQMALTLGRTIP